MKKPNVGLFLSLLFIIAMTGCGPLLPVFPDGETIGADAAAQTAVIAGIGADTLDETRDDQSDPEAANGLHISVDSTLGATAGQIITLTFDNGIVDQATLATGITLRPLTTATATTAFGQGTALTPTATQVLLEGTTGSKVILTYDLAGTAISNMIELVVSASTLTANGGTLKLNLDGDYAMGEVDHDDHYGYLTVTGAPVTLAAGLTRDPRDSILWLGGGALTAGVLTSDFSIQNSIGGVTDMTAASLSPGFVLQKMDAAGSFSTVTTTATFAAGTLSVLLPAAPVAGEVYRWKTDAALSTESVAVAGFVHGRPSWYRGSVRDSDINARVTYTYRPIGTVPTTFTDLAAATAKFYSSSDLRTGLDFSATAKSFTVSNGGTTPATIVTLNANYANITALVAAITAGLPAGISAAEYDRTGDGVNDTFYLQTAGTGTAAFFTIGAGATSALSDLGLTAGTYTGQAAFTGNEFTGGSFYISNGAYYLDLNFGKGFRNTAVNHSTVVPAGLQLLGCNAAGTTYTEIVPWLAADMVWLTDTTCRIKFPSGYIPHDYYRIKVLPTVTTEDGIPYGANQGKNGYFYLTSVFDFVANP